MAASRLSAGELDVTRGTEPTLSRGKGSLAWVRDLSANSIWRMPVDQSRRPPEPLTNSAAVDVDAEWSSNGRMVFRSDRSGVNELWIASADGSRPWQATRSRGPFVGDPHWSPDGRAIAFTSHADGNPDIYLMRCEQDAVACSEPRQLTRTPATDANPTWSADGRWIYFSSSPKRATMRSGECRPTACDAGADDLEWRIYGSRVGRRKVVVLLEALCIRQLLFGELRCRPAALGSRKRWSLPRYRSGPRPPGRWALGSCSTTPLSKIPAVRFPPVRAVDVETGRTRDLPWETYALGGASRSRRTGTGWCARRSTAL